MLSILADPRRTRCLAYTERDMRRLSSLIAIFVLLAAAAPSLACVTAEAMSREQSACCRVMHGKCGEMAKQGCCRTALHTGERPELTATAPATGVHWAVLAWLPPTLPLLQRATLAIVWAPDAHAPPGALAARTPILRI